MSNKHLELLTRHSSAESLNIGHGNFLSATRIVAILEPGSLPMKRLREKACDLNMLIDATAGRKTRSVLVTDSNHVVLSALGPQTLQERLLVRIRIPNQTLGIDHGQLIS